MTRSRPGVAPHLVPDGPPSRYLQGLRAERQRVQQQLDALEDRTLPGIHGGRRGGVHTVREVRVIVADLKAQVADAAANGSRRHRTVPGWLRRLALIPVSADFLVVSLYIAVLLNVRLDSLSDTPVEALASAVFALMISLGVFLVLRWIAIRRRPDKNEAGRYEPAEAAGWLPRSETLLVVVLITGIATVMLVRLLGDAAAAGVQLGAVWVVALFLAVVTGALNWCLYLIEFYDGSDETHALDHWGAGLAAVERRAARLRARLRELDAKLAVAEDRGSSSHRDLEQPEQAG